MEDQASFRVKYDFHGPQHQKYRDLYRLHEEKFSLPKTWNVEPEVADIGHDHCRGEWIFHGLFFLLLLFSLSYVSFVGDRKHLNDAKKSVQDFYKDLLITMEDHP